MKLDFLRNYKINSCLDIGAHHGSFYFAAKDFLNISKWLLVEANKDCYNQLASLNVPFLIAMLSDSIKTIPYFRNKLDKTCTGNSYYRELTHHYSDENIDIDYITTHTLDQITHDTFDLIKLDTQGSEIDILKGGTNVLNNAKFIIIETSTKPYNQDAPLQEEVVTFMKNNNYELVEVVAEVSHTYQQDLLFKKNNI